MSSLVCQYAEKCPLFNGQGDIIPSLEKILRERYCYAGNVSCARYRVREALGAHMLPAGLLPTEHAVAEKLIDTHS